MSYFAFHVYYFHKLFKILILERLTKRTCTCTSSLRLVRGTCTRLVRGTCTRHCNAILHAVKQASRVRVHVEPRCYKSTD